MINIYLHYTQYNTLLKNNIQFDLLFIYSVVYIKLIIDF